jgi:tetratricopeptide repeat protein 8
MVSQMDGPFINISRLNFSKYASDKQLSKLLFNYIYYQQNDIRNVRVLLIVYSYHEFYIF